MNNEELKKKLLEDNELHISDVLNAECKTKTGTQSEAQKEFETRVKELNGHYFIFRSLEEFQENINKHLNWLLCKN